MDALFRDLLPVDLMADLLDEECCAIIDGLCFILYADKDIDRDDILEFHNLMAAFPWDDAGVGEEYLSESLERAQEWDDEEGDMDDLVNGIVDRMSAETYAAVYELMVRVVVADDSRSESKDAMLETFLDTFGLDPEDVEAIEERARL